MSNEEKIREKVTGETAVERRFRMQPDSPVGNKNTLATMLRDPGIMKSMSEGISKLIPIEKLIKMGIIAAQRTPKLLQCTQNSIIFSLMTSGQLGLDCSGILGQAYLIPYKNQATFIIGYKGLVTLAYRSGQVRSISTDVVFQDEPFTFKRGTKTVLEHIPNYRIERDYSLKGIGEIECVYCIVELTNGSQHIEVMGVGAIEKIRKSSRNGDGDIWTIYWCEQAKKTVYRRCSKWIPLSIDYHDEHADAYVNAISVDNSQFEDADYVDIEPPEFESSPPITEAKKPKVDKVKEPEAPEEPPAESLFIRRQRIAF